MTAPTATPAAADAATGGRPAFRALLPWLVTTAAVVVAVLAVWQWRTLAAEIGPIREAEAARTEVEAAAGTFLLELTTWDAVAGLGPTRARLTELGTGAFLDEVDRLFDAELAADLRDVAATSDGEVQDLFVQRLDGERAVVFGVVLQTQDTDETDPDTIVRSARVVLERVDGTWKVAAVEMVDAGAPTLDGVTSGSPEGGP